MWGFNDAYNLLTAFRHIPGETRDIAYRTLATMAEKKPARSRA